MNSLDNARFRLRKMLAHDRTNLAIIGASISSSTNQLERFKDGEDPTTVWPNDNHKAAMRKLVDELFAGTRTYDADADELISTNVAETMPQGVMMPAPNGLQLSPQSDLDVGRGFVVVHQARGDKSLDGMPRD